MPYFLGYLIDFSELFFRLFMYLMAGTVYISINSTVTHLYSHVVGIHYKVGIIYEEVSFAAST